MVALLFNKFNCENKQTKSLFFSIFTMPHPLEPLYIFHFVSWSQLPFPSRKWELSRHSSLYTLLTTAPFTLNSLISIFQCDDDDNNKT